jgi:hypothetical protein
MEKAHGKSFAPEADIPKETLEKTKASTHQCPVCDKMYNRAFSLERHMTEHEVNNIIFKCKHCDKMYNRKDNFVRYEQKNHHLYPFDFDAAASQSTNSLKCHICCLGFGAEKEKLFAHITSKVCYDC